RDRVAAGLASDLLRGGPHLGGGGRHGRRGPLVPRVRGALRRPGGGRPRHGPLGGHRPHAGPQDPGPRGPPPHRAGGPPVGAQESEFAVPTPAPAGGEDTVLVWLYVMDAFEGGLPSARYLGLLADAAEAANAPESYVRDLRTRNSRNVGPGA